MLPLVTEEPRSDASEGQQEVRVDINAGPIASLAAVGPRENVSRESDTRASGRPSPELKGQSQQQAAELLYGLRVEQVPEYMRLPYVESGYR